MTKGEAMVLESRAARCLAQGDGKPEMLQVAVAFSKRAARLLHREKYFSEASFIAKQLLTVTIKDAI